MGLGDWFSGLADRAMDGVSKAIGGGVKNWIREKVPGASFFLGGSETATPGASGSSGGFLGDLGGKLLGAAKGEGMSLIGQIGLAFVAAMAGKHFGGGSFLMAAAIAVVTFIAGSMMMGSSMSGGSQKPAAPGAGRQVDGQTRGQNPTLGQVQAQTGQDAGAIWKRSADDFASPQAQQQRATAQYAVDYLVKKGVDQKAAIALVAGTARESGLNTCVAGDLSLGAECSVGIAQWNRDRKAAFAKQFGHALDAKQDASGKPLSEQDRLNRQLDFMVTELNGTHKSAYAAMLAAKDVGDAVAASTKLYFVPANQPQETVKAAAKAQHIEAEYLARVASSGTGSQPLSLTPREAAAAAIRKASFSSSDAITNVAEATTPQSLSTPTSSSSGGGLGQKSPSGTHA